MPIKTNITGYDYELGEVVRIINPIQAKKYIKHNVYPIDLYASSDCEGNDILVYVFYREDTKEVSQLWNERKLL